MSRTSDLLKKADSLSDRSLSRKLRLAAVDAIQDITKEAQSQQTGIFQVFRDDHMEYPTRQSMQKERGGEVDYEKKYDLSDADKEDMDSSRRPHDRSLSTRYSPDRVGVQARRIADGVYQDPYTNKIYNWNEGFKTEDGEEFSGGHVSLQTDLTSSK